jgi:DNA repair protein RecN (Recombination protein N)
MFSRLSIQNYALIESLEMQPHPAMNIITGETGAGKSIMLGAVGLLLGNRADTKVLYHNDRKCIIEGEFNIASYNIEDLFTNYDLDFEASTLIRREITPSGKSRAFVNDTPVTLEVLKDLGSHLMDIHSQHQTLQLSSSDFQLNIIDTYANNRELLDSYREHFALYKNANKKLLELQANAERIAQESDYNAYLLKELVEANLIEDEQEGLEDELKVLEHAEEIKANLVNILSLLDRNELNISSMLQEARTLSNQISGYSENLNSISERLNESFIELTDLLREVELQDSNLEVDMERTEALRDRISMLYHLQNKHHVDSIKGLLEIQERLEQETFLANNLESEIEQAKSNLEDAEAKLKKIALELSKKRSSTFDELQTEVAQLLQQLGMPDGKIVLESSHKEYSENGIDDIVILFSANKGVPPAPLGKVASGGEFSRLMFCFKYILADKTALPTMVFDEIDSGISGEIALQMGTMLQDMARKHQIITISHLPQIAARGQAHYFVYKDFRDKRSVSSIKKLSEEEKVQEVAKMIGGDNPAKSAIASAQDLISLST